MGTRVVPRSDQVRLKEEQSLNFLRRTGTLGDEFFGKQNIDAM